MHGALIERPCVGCAEKSFNGEESQCIRLHAIISCSDMDPSYALYGKDIFVQSDQVDDIEDQN